MRGVQNWELGEQLREFEKKNAMFTSALRSGAQSDMNHEGMTFNVGEGPEPQTNVLHEAIRSMHSVHESFVRIVPPQPFYQYGELKFDSNPVTAKVSRLRRPSSAKPMSSAQHSYPQRPGSAPLTQSGRTTVSVDQTKTEPSVRQVTDESALSGIAHGSSRAFSFKRSKSGASNQLIPGSSSSPGGGASPVGGAQAAKAAAQVRLDFCRQCYELRWKTVLRSTVKTHIYGDGVDILGGRRRCQGGWQPTRTWWSATSR